MYRLQRHGPALVQHSFGALFPDIALFGLETLIFMGPRMPLSQSHEGWGVGPASSVWVPCPQGPPCHLLARSISSLLPSKATDGPFIYLF